MALLVKSRRGWTCNFAVIAIMHAPGTGATPPSVPSYDHVVVVVMENHAYAEIIGDLTNAPYINQLALGGASFTQSSAIEHPSQPNYLDLFSGSNQAVIDDTCPHTFMADNLGHQLIAANLTFAGYSENLPAPGSTNCATADSLYARKHNPWSDFSDLDAAATNLPFTSFPSDFTTLPTLSFVIPNQCSDMHGVPTTCPSRTSAIIAAGDTWLSTNIAAYADWAPAHNSLLVITWDEDDGSESNRIPTIFYGALVIPGDYAEAINHFNVLATLEFMYGLPPLGSAAGKSVISDAFDRRIFADAFE
jgi:hypothetical protein